MHGTFDPATSGWDVLDEDDGFTLLVGPIWVHREGGFRHYAFLAGEKHKNRNGKVHGGMVATFADKVMGMTAWNLGGRPQQLATIQLETSFIRAVRSGDFVEARCRVIRFTRTVAFMESTMNVGDAIVATASGIWMCNRGSEFIIP